MSKKHIDKKSKPNIVKKEKSSKSGGFSITLILLSLVTVIVAAVVYRKYVELTTVPDMPQLDLNLWWGPNTTIAQDTSIRPYRVMFTDAMIEQLNKKFEIYRNVVNRKKSLDSTSNYGMNTAVWGQIFAHWQFKYSYEGRAKFLNKFDHFKTNIQGLDIHYIHVKPKVDKNVKVIPLLILHGWPGSVREFYEAFPLLTSVRPGYDFVFEVIAPSLPGFVLSQGTNKQGFAPYQMAIVLRNLMQRLGFSRYYVQGGDYGNTIGTDLITIFPNEVLGYHTNFPGSFSKRSVLTLVLGAICPSFFAPGLEDRLYPLKEKVEFMLEETGYMHLQSTKPDTLGIALTDSPVGLAAYIIEKFLFLTNPNYKALEDGGLSNFSITDLLDNVMLYWSTGSIGTAMRIYKESVMKADVEQVLSQIPTPVPTWALRFKYEVVQHPDIVIRSKYPNLLGSTNPDFGGHFAAFERPTEFVNDVFLAVQNFIEFHKR